MKRKRGEILYRLEKYYSPSANMTYTAQLSKSLRGTSYGAETKSLISALYYENRVFVVLVGDNAPQFKKIAKRFMLCWVHEERHYKKLTPFWIATSKNESEYEV